MSELRRAQKPEPAYGGVCVGGPKAGQWVECRTPQYEMLTVKDDIPVLSWNQLPPAMARVEKHLYFCDQFARMISRGWFTAWRHESLANRDEMIAELFKGYRP